jgi:quercetin dioxygenase-like cupin family protein
MLLYNLNDMDSRERVPGFHARMVHSEHMTFSIWDVEAEAVLSEHSHPNEQISTVLEGTFELTVGGDTKSLQPGMVVVIPSDVPHSGRALTPCKMLDVFHPVREDFRSSE